MRYAMIFGRLARHGFDWEYAFPRLYAFYLGDPDESSAGVAEQLERERERAELREFLEEGHHEALARAKDELPPCTVQAYRQVYGGDPPAGRRGIDGSRHPRPQQPRPPPRRSTIGLGSVSRSW